jgi:glutamate dehydrogenase
MPSPTAEILKSELIDELVDTARRRFTDAGPEAAEAAAAFVTASYETIAPADLLARSADDLLAGILSLWELGAERSPRRPELRVYDPEADTHGWSSPFTVVEIVNDDMPFLVDSVSTALARREHPVELVVHPVVTVRRDSRGVRQELVATDADDAALADPSEEGVVLRESYMQLHVARILDPEELVATREELEEVLRHVRSAVDDWKAMRGKIWESIEELHASPELPVEASEVEEAASFLRWLDDNHFTFLGYQELELERRQAEDGAGTVDVLVDVPGTSLGISRISEAQRSGELVLTEKMSRFARRPQVLFVIKANRWSKVHRAAPMDYIGVKRFDGEGHVVGERRFLGLFTSVAYNRRARSIPLLREKVERTLERAGFHPASHDGKALLHILETFPRDELFQISEKRLFEISLGVLQLQDRQRIALFVRRDPFERFVSCLVYAPRDRYNTQLRLAMQEILEAAMGGEMSVHYTQVSDSPLARVHFLIRTTPGEIPAYDIKTLEERLALAARTWSDGLKEVLFGQLDDEQTAYHLFSRYQDAFGTFYQERFGPEDAVVDIETAERVLASGELGMHLYRPEGYDESRMRFKIYHRGEAVALSDALPLLENMGLRVQSEIPFRVRPHGEEDVVWIHDFDLASSDGTRFEFDRLGEIFPEAFGAAWTGQAENDGFNRLVVRAGLAWHEVLVLRAYAKFMRQGGSAFSQLYMQETLSSSPELARLLVELFVTRFDPHDRDGAEERIFEIQEHVQHTLEQISSLDEDRILRRFLNLIHRTLRTNYFQTDENGGRKPYLSMKLDSTQIDLLPKPRPRYEIFVYSARMEAVHLRGGKVARGGIRWSDRREDFRTEILGLMKAQMVKNAVIVPVGAKGGFVVKNPPPPTDREAWLAEGIACYETMMRGLLDLTDNLVDGRIVPPPDVWRFDDDDPYLVVAADKGTASFSDIANRIAAEYDFWLGDAFASGGSAGYDHKAMGITARGAWEAVKRHFRELGTDIQEEPFTAVGVGDMSGDVFGNGMLLSPVTRLVGAFNHLHVFVDPDPDPAVSFAERKRLFELPRSSWADYDPAKLSPGGAVFDRAAKSVELTPEIQKLTGISRAQATPNELIQALLTAKVDLLWFGGIGTFVKARSENNAEVGDRANDAVRVDGRELRALVVGEGANLGVTQLGRIEYALAGGQINTDAIDNSGGVDTSDHEVNIKILLGDVMAEGGMDLAQRDRLLVEMTEEVAGLVLRHNYLQTQAITVTEAQGVSLLDVQQQMMRQLERAEKLDRAIEQLPDDELLAERQAAGLGLTRPELAVLLAYSKIFLYENVLRSSLVEDPLLLEDLVLYFPRPLRKEYRRQIEGHRLRPEIIATYVTNSMVNRVGPTFVSEMIEETGAEPADVARAYTVARESFDLRRLWAAIESLDNQVPASVQTRMILAAGDLVARVTLWFLRASEDNVEIGDISALTQEFRPAVRALADGLDDILPRKEMNGLEARQKSYTKEGVPDDTAYRVASLTNLVAACDIWNIARQTPWEIVDVARVYFALGERFRLDWLRAAARRLAAESRWEKAAITAIVDALFAHQSQLTRQVLETSGLDEDGSVRRAIEEWATTKPVVVSRTDALFKDLPAQRSLDLAMLMVADDQVRRLVGD